VLSLRRIAMSVVGLTAAAGVVVISPNAAYAAYPCSARRDGTASWKVVSTCAPGTTNWHHQAWARCTVRGSTNYYWGNIASGSSASVVYCPSATSAMTSYGTVQGAGNP
jgi:hypothetical protein